MISFVKYHGTGNDFILIDDRNLSLNLRESHVELLCHRHFGIGADGLILIRNKAGYDFEMVYYNSDGRLGSMCGNGSRCAVAFAHSLGITGNEVNFLTSDGRHEARILSTDPYLVKIKMGNVKGVETNPGYYFLDTGSPHVVMFTKEVEHKDVFAEGRTIRNNERFRKEGTNVNFVEEAEGGLFIRTYERGVEDETLSCGTGVTASVIAAHKAGLIGNSSCQVMTRGGKLLVSFIVEEDTYRDVWLEGPATEVFAGTLKSI